MVKNSQFLADNLFARLFSLDYSHTAVRNVIVRFYFREE